MRTLQVFSEKKFWWGDHGRDYPNLMFWLITAGFLFSYSNAVYAVVENSTYIMTSSRSFLVRFGAIMILAPATWIAFFGLHRLLKRLHENLDRRVEQEILFKRVQGAVIAFGLVSYFILSLCLLLIVNPLRS